MRCILRTLIILFLLALKKGRMKNLSNTTFLSLVLIVFSCSAPKVVVNYKTNAEQAELQGDYKLAVTEWESYFTQQEIAEVKGATFAQAARAAYKAGMNNKTVEWFDQAGNKNYADKEMYLILVKIYRSQDNLSKELSSLEYYSKNLDENNFEVNKRLFEIYYKTDVKDKAIVVWNRLDKDSLNNESLLEKYFQINKELDNTAVVDSVSLELLKIDPKHVKALEWNATKYYWKAENHYKQEMKKYEENKTGLQYVLLRNELKQVTADFKKSLNYFDRLWDIDPGKKYASYLSNIYVRLDNDQKAKYYRGFLD